MISIDNYIYTQRGIYKIEELYNLCKDDYNNRPSIMSFDTTNKLYTFTNDYSVIVKPEDYTDPLVEQSILNFDEMYECKFVNLFTNRTITIDVSEDTYILQYNIVDTDKDSLYNKFYGVLRYLNSNKNKRKVKDTIGWKTIRSLINNATYMPNISLGDTVTKFMDKQIRSREISFDVVKKDSSGTITDTVPIFIQQNASNYDDFILIKTFNNYNEGE